MDVFQELGREDSKMNQYMDTFFKDLESMWSDAGVIYSDPWVPPRIQATETSVNPLPVPPPTPTPRFRPPACPYARSIWDACGFRSACGERQVTIEDGLEQWATHHKLAFMGKDDHPWIEWKVGNTPVSGRWSAFVKWFLCCCTK